MVRNCCYFLVVSCNSSSFNTFSSFNIKAVEFLSTELVGSFKTQQVMGVGGDRHTKNEIDRT